jgi:hypothetical protein
VPKEVGVMKDYTIILNVNLLGLIKQNRLTSYTKYLKFTNVLKSLPDVGRCIYTCSIVSSWNLGCHISYTE